MAAYNAVVRCLVLSLIALTVALPGWAQERITCMAPTGWSYFFSGSLEVEQDGISGGTVSLVQDGAGRWDIVYSTTSNQFTARGDGAKVEALVHEVVPGSVILVVSYPLGTAETYHLYRRADGKHELVITSAKPAVAAPARSSMFASKCTG